MPLDNKKRRVGGKGFIIFGGKHYSVRHIPGIEVGDIVEVGESIAKHLKITIRGCAWIAFRVKYLPGGFTEYDHLLGEV